MALPPALAAAVARFEATRAKRRHRAQTAAQPREIAPRPVLARQRAPAEAAKASPKALAEAIKGELPWWARD